jgi:hypothetical protein
VQRYPDVGLNQIAVAVLVSNPSVVEEDVASFDTQVARDKAGIGEGGGLTDCWIWMGGAKEKDANGWQPTPQSVYRLDEGDRIQPVVDASPP